MNSHVSEAVFRRGRLLLWGACLAVAIALPLVFKSGFMLSLLCQMGVMVVFALSYNMLLGQTGLLSFGHAVYFGMGAFISMHALNIIGKDGGPLLVALLPLVGGLAGLLAGVVLGYVTTKKAGTTFAMISLGIGELVAACALMFPGFFGGEGGVSGNRVIGKGNLLGFTWGPQVEMYGLIVAWAFLATVAMFALTQTPLGRMANAVRDNPERAEFVGYDTQRVRYLMLILSGFFAGVAGGLTALNYEIVTAETLNAHTSGVVLLMTFVGGIGFFYGPIIGAILVTVMQIVIGGMTQAWLLYFGLFFLFMVLMAPGGIASVISMQRNLWQAGLFGRMVPHYLAVALPMLVLTAGLVGLIEMSYALLAGEGVGAGDTATQVMGMQMQLNSPAPWAIALATTAVGMALTRWIGGRTRAAWNATLSTLHGDRT
ncbi:MAG: branched-chain amino acid ABC transporter permease [Rhodocyclales bacterium]|nr:branched-chain amino acid ABC transporter permease [Rhodocyclales bacterium]